MKNIIILLSPLSLAFFLSCSQTPETPVEPAKQNAIPMLGLWETWPDLSAPRSAAAVIALDDGSFLLAGGFQGSFDASSSVSSYEPISGVASALTPLPLGLAGAAFMQTDDGFILSGGLEKFSTTEVLKPQDACFAYSLNTQDWSACAPIGNGGTFANSFAAMPNALAIFGGLKQVDYTREGPGSLSTRIVQRYNHSDDAWQAETLLPELRDGAATIIHENRAYVIGGWAQGLDGGQISLSPRVLIYNFKTNTWETSSDTMRVNDLPTPRANLACTLYGQAVYCFGGYNQNGVVVDVVDRLDLESGIWTSMPPLPQPLSEVRPVSRDDGIWILGGMDETYNDVSKVYRLR